MDFGNKCVILTRVSTLQQDYDAQINDLRAWALSLGLVVEKNISTKESGFRSWDKKEGFKEVIDYMASNQCRIILCTEPSRLGRDKFILEQVKNWLTTNKIQLYIKDINFKLFNDNGEVDMSTDILFSVHASIAQVEMKEKKKRMSRGIKELQKEGYCITGKTPFGYSKTNTEEKIKGKYRNTFIINEEQAEQIKTIYNWYLNGIDGDRTRCSINHINIECIAKGFDGYLHSRRNVNKCLKEESYTGHKITNNRRKNPEFWNYGNEKATKYILCSSDLKYPPIISAELFNKVQIKMKGENTHIDSTSNENADKSRKHITLLSKIIKCPSCSHFLIGNYRNKQKYLVKYYKCSYIKCPQHSTYSMRFLDGAIWAFCTHHFGEFKKFLSNYSESIDIDSLIQKVANLETEKNNCKMKLDNYTSNYLKTIKYSSTKESQAIYDKNASELTDKISGIEGHIVKVREEIDVYNNPSFIQSEISLITKLVVSSKSKMKKYIHQMIDFIVPIYRDSRYTILWIFPKYSNKIYKTTDEVFERESYRIYLIIDGKDNNRPQIKYINSKCNFDLESKQFILSESLKSDVEDVFKDIEEVYFKVLAYKELDIYSDDYPKIKK